MRNKLKYIVDKSFIDRNQGLCITTGGRLPNVMPDNSVSVSFVESEVSENLYCDTHVTSNTSEHNNLISLGDYPSQRVIGNVKLCGYIEPNGTYHKCGHCEHELVIRELVLKNYLDEYLNTDVHLFDIKPFGMLQEEYFAMKILGWVKISSFELEKETMYSFNYNTLTPEQIDIIYPK